MHLNIVSLSKHSDNLSDFLASLIFKFPIISLPESKIAANIPIKNIDIPGYHVICCDKTKSSDERRGFFISDKFSFDKHNDLIVSNYNTLESTFLEIILPQKRSFLCGCIHKHHQILISDLIISYNSV